MCFRGQVSLVQFSSVTQSCPTLCNSMKCRTPGLPVHHQLPEFTQTHVHWVSDAIQPAHPLSSPSPRAFNLFQHQGLFKWVSSSHQVAKVLKFQLQHQSFQWTPFIGRTDVGSQVKVQSYILLVQASTPWYSSLQEKEGKVIQSLDIGLRWVPKVEIVLIKSLRKLQASLYYAVLRQSQEVQCQWYSHQNRYVAMLFHSKNTFETQYS